MCLLAGLLTTYTSMAVAARLNEPLRRGPRRSLNSSVRGPLKWSERPRRFRCSHCPKAFVVKRDLIGHMNAMHQEESLYWCSSCGKTFNHYSAWRKHINLCAGALK